jgi:hypothetical protein
MSNFLGKMPRLTEEPLVLSSGSPKMTYVLCVPDALCNSRSWYGPIPSSVISTVLL